MIVIPGPTGVNGGFRPGCLTVLRVAAPAPDPKAHQDPDADSGCG
jgi:hypothetical protein